MDSNRRNINRKREDYIDWHDYFMATAFLAAKRSKDPCSQVGACIVNEDKKVVGVGYNGMPTGCSDDEFPWAKESNDPQDNKYYYVCHAEVNAVLNKNCADVKNCTIYVGLFPCNECAKVIIQAGIKEVIYLSDKHSHKASTMASKKMLDAANVKYWQYVPQSSKIVIDFNEIDWNDMNQLRQTPKKSNDKVDDDLIEPIRDMTLNDSVTEPIRDMTLNDSVTDNHSKSLDYISGSTEKGKISEVNKGYSTLLQDALSNRPASNQSLLLNIMTMLCHMVERSEEQTEVLRKQNNQLSDDFAVLKLMMQGLLEARPGRNLVAEAPEFLPEGSVQQAATKKRPPVSKPIKELVPTLAPLGYSENETPRTILDLSKVERVKIRYREALEAAGKRQSVGRAMLCRIILHESIPALPVDDNVSEFETLRRAVELYILKIQDKRMYLKKRAEYCPDIAEDS